MKIEQRKWHSTHGWKEISHQGLHHSANLVLAFGSTEALSDPDRYHELRSFYPNAHILTCSTAGEIQGSKIIDNSVAATAIYFERTTVRVAVAEVTDVKKSYSEGFHLSEQLAADDLAHLFVLSDGQMVNGSELVKGLNKGLRRPIPVTGGLAGDGTSFKKTLVGVNAPPTVGKVGVVAFYGSKLKIGHGSKGGWDAFGMERTVTRSEGNVLYEFDNKSALQLYKDYLGPLALDLPGSALLFPLAMRLPDCDEDVVRTVLSINESDQSMTFAGDIPINAKVRLMKANFDRLIDGAIAAADKSLSTMGSFQPELAILISCVGRRVVLNHRAEEEVDEATRLLGGQATITGFYSYGEISPVVNSTSCELHNQTMTITVYREL
jgi:hypothetical protein